MAEQLDPGLVEQFLEDPDLLDKLLKEYRQEIPELGFLLEIENPEEREDQLRGLIVELDPSVPWRVVSPDYPSLPVSVGGSFDDLFSVSDPGSGLFSEWRNNLERVYADLRQKVFPAVGSLELADHHTHIGTGWLVGEQMVITNRHVLIDSGLAYRRDDGEITYEEESIRFDLRNGRKKDEQKEFTVIEVLYLAWNNEPDVALLRVKNESSGGDALPAPLILSQKEPTSGQMVLTVGYPGDELDDDCKDYYGNNLEQIFPGSISPDGQPIMEMFNVKRMSVGYLDEITPSRLYHFCNSTPGSSGSAIINLEGEVVGLHYGGNCDEQRNFAVPAEVIQQTVESLP